MLRITVELVPWGIESSKSTLGVAEIANDGTGTAADGNYKVQLYDRAGRKWKSCRVEGFPRKRLLAWDLLYRALRVILSERNDHAS